MIKTLNIFHFPEGFDDGHWVDTSYCDTQFNVGEKIIIEGEPQVFVVVDIQNQFRRMERNEAGQALRMIMRNVILECFEAMKKKQIKITDDTDNTSVTTWYKGWCGLMQQTWVSDQKHEIDEVEEIMEVTHESWYPGTEQEWALSLRDRVAEAAGVTIPQ